MTHFIDLERLWEGAHHSRRSDATESQSGYGRVSVVLVATGKYDLVKSLSSVVAQPFLRDVVVVDMGLSVSQRSLLDAFIAKNKACRVVLGRSFASLANAYNLGSHYATGDHLFFMTDRIGLPSLALGRLIALARNKSFPFVIGMASDPNNGKAHWDRFRWLGQMIGLKREVVRVSETQRIFSDVPYLPHEALLVSNRHFSLLKGMDESCSDQTMAWDFCLRVHYAGGQVGMMNTSFVEYHPLSRSFGWRRFWRQSWQNYCAWRQFFKKYVSYKTHFVRKTLAHSAILLQCFCCFDR